MSLALTQALGDAQQRMAQLATDVVTAPGQTADIAAAWTRALQTPAGIRAFAYVLVLLCVAGAVEWFYWTFAAQRQRALVATIPTGRRDAFVLGTQILILRLVGALLFGLALAGGSAAFAWPAGVQDVVVLVALGLTAVRLAWIGAATLAAPTLPRLRLLRATSRRAAGLVWRVTSAAALLLALVILADLVERLDGGRAVSALLRLSALVLVATAALAWARRRDRARRWAKGGARRRLRAIPTTFVLLSWMGIVALTWLAGHDRLAMTLVVLSITAAAVSAAGPVVHFLWDVLTPAAEPIEIAAAENPPSDDEHPAVPLVAPSGQDPRHLLRDIVMRAVRFVIAIAGLAVAATVWDLSLVALPSSESAGGRLAARLAGAVAIILVADLAWAAVRGFVTMKLDAIAAAGGDPETGSQARLVTLLPILRKAAGVVIGSMLVLSLLSILGIEVTPLLAGAGIVGIAVGFGAQTLVRDILSGFFYLLEDVFRIGDYIEGGSAKGTVERITLRTVALRHQNGPLHFVPYGALGSVRNNSRDWVIDKFEIPLPTDVDSEFVRKLVKKIGQEMAEDPSFASIIVAPLKTKLYKITPGVKIFRCKVQTPPGKQFEVRGEAYKRIEAALRANGIRFAENNAVVVQNGIAAAQPASA